MSKRLILPVLGILGLLIGAYTGYWLWLAAQVERAVADWTGRQEARGWTVAGLNPEVRGYPTAVRLDGTRLRLEGPDGTMWQAADWALAAAPWSPRTLDVTAAGQRVRIPAPVGAAGGLGAVDGSSRAMDMTVQVDLSGQITGVEGTLAAIDLTLPGQPQVRIAETAVFGEFPHSGRMDEDPARLELQLREVALDPAPFPDVSDTAERWSLSLHVPAPVPGSLTAPALSRWQAAGGGVVVESIEAVWSSLEFSGEGRLSLTPALQPRGQIDTRTRGWDIVLDALVDTGVLNEQQAGFNRLGLSLFSSRAEDGTQVLELPLILSEGWLSLGPLRLAPLPEIEWPER